ncbi:MAG: adenylate/guanylate cyclase domain-containing protein [Patescibacteria group bacterium]
MKNSLTEYFKRGRSKNSFPKFLTIGIFIFILTYSSYGYGVFYGIENFFEDILFSARPVSSNILILEIDNQSIEKIGQWPWRREVFAKVFSLLNKSKPKSVGLDVMMSEPSHFGKEDDILLADALGKISYPVVMPVEALSLNINRTADSFSENFLKPRAVFQEQGNVSLGHVNLINDRDGIVRSLPFRIGDARGDVYEGLAYKTIEKSGFEIKKSSDINPVERIVFSGPSGSVRRIPFWKVLEEVVSSEIFENKIIFIGATAADLHDEKPTPFDKGTQMSGVEIQAQIGNMILNNYRLRDLNSTILFVWFLVASLIPCFLFYFVKTAQRAIFLNLFVGVIYSVIIIQLFDVGVVANFVHINGAWISTTFALFFYRFLTTDKEKREMKTVFSKYVSADVLNEILKDTSRVKLGGEEREVTVFFSDIRNFTTLSEGMSPSRLTGFLNKYFTRMTGIVLRRRGVVDKYIGDAIMSFWGAPIDNKEQALDAVLTSLDMIEALGDFNKENNKEGDPEIDIGIGLNTGRVTVGNMGSEARFDYTIMGDAVNLASRLEGQTKTYGVKIIISESTKNKLGAENIEKYGILIRELDKIKVKGKTEFVTIFEVVARSNERKVGSILGDFDRLRLAYYEGKWAEGVTIAEKILERIEDRPTEVLMDRCLHFIKNEPKDWLGIYEMTSK